jgi:hypothetical protein
MKPSTMQFYRAIAAALSLVVLLGTASTVVAGDAKRIVRLRYVPQTQNTIRDTGANSTPRPVADETPINPELFKNNAPDNSTPSSDSNKAPVKRTMVRRR